MTAGYFTIKDMEFLSARDFLRRLFFSKERFGILWARGGLGNQLFQISALSYFSRKLDFTPIIHPCNLRQHRDAFTPQYRGLEVNVMFSPVKRGVDPSPALELILRITYRIFSILFKDAVYNEGQLLNTSKASLPKIFFIQDYFESLKYPDSMSEISLKHLTRVISRNSSKSDLNNHLDNNIRAMMHVRLTDSHFKVIDKSRFHKIEASIRKMDAARDISILDIYSDDLTLAKELLEGVFHSIRCKYPEENQKLDPVALLATFIQYDYIIASKSTLSWWACYLRSRLLEKEAVIFADFSPKLMREGWLHIEH